MSFTSSITVALNKARSFVLPLTSFSLDFVVLSCVTLGSPSPRPDLDIETLGLALAMEVEAERETESVECLGP
jgi:hypothetical protein